MKNATTNLKKGIAYIQQFFEQNQELIENVFNKAFLLLLSISFMPMALGTLYLKWKFRNNSPISDYTVLFALPLIAATQSLYIVALLILAGY